jgi:hypothetical protein
MKVVISGSFRKHLDDIMLLKEKLESDGIEVLKPVNADTINNVDNPEFVKFKGEERKTEEQLQEEYDIDISHSDAHIIFDKDGYIGSSALRELCMGAGNNALSINENNRGIGDKRYSQVYLLEPINETIMDPGVAIIIYALVKKGNIKVGLDKMYDDFGIIKGRSK